MYIDIHCAKSRGATEKLSYYKCTNMYYSKWNKKTLLYRILTIHYCFLFSKNLSIYIVILQSAKNIPF